ncbi:hypothetical protein [Kineococcus sp. SYSU DK001]|uniref:hypothetical protein n=1 Tax=Kineococcus sp. SYSU DK001 TaxID=3383122 RepID=UPI003D7ED9BD
MTPALRTAAVATGELPGGGPVAQALDVATPVLLLEPVRSELGAATPAPGLHLVGTGVQAHGASTPALAAHAERWGQTPRATATAAATARQGTLSAR